jgi:CHAD domain-containing protein
MKRKRTPSAETPAAQLRRLLATVDQERDRTLADPDASAVHDLRVSIRRLEQALERFGPHLKGAHRLARTVRRWFKAAGRVRDRDITLDLMESCGLTSPRLRTAVDEDRARRTEKLLQRLRKRTPLAPSWKRPFQRRALLANLPELAAAYFAAGEQAAAVRHDARDLHRFRLRSKELRYTLELAAPAHPLDRFLRQMQRTLGEMADAEAAQRVLLQAGANPRSLSPFRRISRERQQQFRAEWKAALPGPESAAEWIAQLPTSSTSPKRSTKRAPRRAPSPT